jgi:RNA polymerase sigma-70 factor (ECF subfamily)
MHVVNAATLDKWNALDDEQVVSHVLAGQTSLFEVLIRRHNERVYRAARAIVHDDGEAEDVMQQAYVNAYAHLRQFDGRAAFATWLTRIAIHEALARARRRGRFRSYDGEEHAMDNVVQLRSRDNPEHQTLSRELRVLLESAVDELPDGLREVFVLRLVEGLSTAETADCLGINEDAVKTRLTRARARLRDDLSDRMGAVAPEIFRFFRPRCDRVVAAVLARIS